jgi:two-component sensor histidine kinase
MLDRVEQQFAAAEAVLIGFSPEIAADQCAIVYDRLRPIMPFITNIVHSGLDGRWMCSALTPENADQRTSPAYVARLQAGERLIRTDAIYGNVSDRWIFGLLRRLDDEDGNFAGVASLGLDVNALLPTAGAGELPDGLEVSLADREGAIFGSSRFRAIRPERLAEASRAADGILYIRDSLEGEKVDVVLTPLGDTGVYSVVSRPSPGPLSEFALTPAKLVGLPLLAFLVALIASWWAVDRLVLKWFRPLRRLSIAYGEGLYDLKTRTFTDAPQEFADLAAAFGRMAERIGHRDRALREALATRDAAVKEIHHRIKNNLQIVTSFLSLQGRNVKDPKALGVLASVRHRIDALSIIHQTLYQYESFDAINLRAFFDALFEHLQEALGMEDSNVELDWTVEDMMLLADQAIPMALFVLEAVTNSMKYAFCEDGGRIDVSITQEGDQIVLSIRDNGAGCEMGPGSPAGVGLGSRLMQAFAKQLGGKAAVATTPGQGYCTTLTVPIRPSAQAEASPEALTDMAAQ